MESKPIQKLPKHCRQTKALNTHYFRWLWQKNICTTSRRHIFA